MQESMGKSIESRLNTLQTTSFITSKNETKLTEKGNYPISVEINLAIVIIWSLFEAMVEVQ